MKNPQHTSMCHFHSCCRDFETTHREKYLQFRFWIDTRLVQIWIIPCSPTENWLHLSLSVNLFLRSQDIEKSELPPQISVWLGHLIVSTDTVCGCQSLFESASYHISQCFSTMLLWHIICQKVADFPKLIRFLKAI